MEKDHNNLNLYQHNNKSNQDKVIATEFIQTSQMDLNNILNQIENQHQNIFADLQNIGIPRNITRAFIRNIIGYVLQYERNYTGTLQQRLNQIYRDMRRNNTLFPILRIYGGSGLGRLNSIIRDIIEITLLYLEQGAPSPLPPSPGPVPPPRRQWSNWQDLGGGTINSGPAAATTASHPLEVFARGSQNQLLHRNWNGRSWSSWQGLGGTITSDPGSVSWGGNRLDVFARGSDNHLWHIYTNN